MAKFNVNDKVTILNGSPLWFDKEGTVKEIDDDGNVKVQVMFETEDETKPITNVFSEDDLELLSANESLNEGANIMEEIKLTEAELRQWMDDNDANYWDQEITDDNKVAIRGIHEVLGVYDFDKETLTLTEGYLKDTPYVEEYDEDEEDEDFIKDYVSYKDINGKNVPSWYFLDKIAVAEGVDESCVCQTAQKFGYKLFMIEAKPTFCKVVVAAKGIKNTDIYNDYADYLQGNACVYEVK